MGVSYLRLGNQSTSLLELLVDAKSQLLRGVTVTLFSALSPWPPIGERIVSRGLPKLDASWGKTNRIDTHIDFSVAEREAEVLVFWQPLDRCDASNFEDRVHFLAVDGRLAGIRFSGLTPGALKIFASGH